MKRYVIVALSIFAAAATVGWKLASHPETSVGLQEISPDPELRTLAAWPDQGTGRYSYSLESQRFRLRHRGDG